MTKYNILCYKVHIPITLVKLIFLKIYQVLQFYLQQKHYKMRNLIYTCLLSNSFKNSPISLIN